MNGFMKTAGAVMRKDWRTLWPFATAVIALTLVLGLGELTVKRTDLAAGQIQMTVWLSIGSLAAVALGFASAAFVVVLIQLDGPAARKADWMARPVPPLALFAAKVAMIFAVIVLPELVAEAVVATVQGSGLAEGLATAYDTFAELSYWLALGVVLAWLTTSGLQAMVIAILYGVLIAASSLFAMAWGNNQIISTTSRMAWFVHEGMWLSLALIGGLSLWLLMRKRDIRAARIAFGAALAAGFLLSFLPARLIFSAHMILAPETGATRRVKVVRETPLCRQSNKPGDVTAGLANLAFVGGAPADTLSYDIALTGLEPGWTARIDMIDVKGASPKQRPKSLGAAPLSNGFKFRVNTAVPPKTEAGPLRYDYAITLFKAGPERTVRADGSNVAMPGPSSCSAKVRRRSVQATCTRSGLEPSLITATIKQGDLATPWCDLVNLGASTAIPTCEPSYGPKLIRALSHAGPMVIDTPDVLDDSPDPVSVTFKPYEVVAHVRRTLEFASADVAAIPVCPQRPGDLEGLAATLAKQSQQLIKQQEELKAEIERRRGELEKVRPGAPASGKVQRGITIERTIMRGG